MNSLANINEYKVSEDIWNCPDQIDEEECTPQIPHFTKQFENTLKDNKGSSNKADFEKDFEGLRNPKIMCLKPNDQVSNMKRKDKTYKLQTKHIQSQNFLQKERFRFGCRGKEATKTNLFRPDSQNATDLKCLCAHETILFSYI
ncbi:unnamed protein product [Moneuplotes crassus]|uniref:Uncharacterized protein n=1 Tax=Euplotes crassus TaxID=5936 RepID=A0AAD2DB10_EUPCR|nr:unnamed protein product [Moneuplotes crassus]